MFSFLKNWMKKGEDKQRSLDELKQDIQEGTTISAGVEDAEGQTEAEGDTADQSVKTVRTELSLHPGWEAALDSEKKYTLRFLQAELPEMEDGTIGVTGFSLIPSEKGLTAAMFFRNGTKHPLKFKNLTLLIMFDDEIYARHSFDLNQLEQIPPYSSRPWEVMFPRSSFLKDNIRFERWKVAIERKRVWPKQLDLDPQMEARMTEAQKERLYMLAQKLRPLAPREVNVAGFDIARAADGRLIVGLLFRNGMSVPYNPEKFHMEILDKAGDLVASGTIDASTVEVKPGTSRPWIVVIPPGAVKKSDADLRRWKVKVT
ncbi:SLAP domain-containing protein [Brevibacillus humidisoli]|uniref:SLAP domain-containing protein n=1 Tax=Brevibacillus humidisoli TaxID=2895522 RepID=UPI001E2C0714|nr:SLAP domain-containing protein [Brevibacillus humidisoli]UFJ40074.1 SLAP domain-containing protein [Brevibacillus humidisoli]